MYVTVDVHVDVRCMRSGRKECIKANYACKWLCGRCDLIAVSSCIFFFMIRRAPRSIPLSSRAPPDMYIRDRTHTHTHTRTHTHTHTHTYTHTPVFYTPPRPHESVLDRVCRSLCEKKKQTYSLLSLIPLPNVPPLFYPLHILIYHTHIPSHH